MIVTYVEGDDGYHIQLETIFDHPKHIAEEAANDYHYNHDGGEASWPVIIEVFKDGKSLGKYSVDREFDPIFDASEV